MCTVQSRALCTEHRLADPAAKSLVLDAHYFDFCQVYYFADWIVILTTNRFFVSSFGWQNNLFDRKSQPFYQIIWRSETTDIANTIYNGKSQKNEKKYTAWDSFEVNQCAYRISEKLTKPYHLNSMNLTQRNLKITNHFPEYCVKLNGFVCYRSFWLALEAHNVHCMHSFPIGTLYQHVI